MTRRAGDRRLQPLGERERDGMRAVVLDAAAGDDQRAGRTGKQPCRAPDRLGGTGDVLLASTGVIGRRYPLHYSMGLKFNDWAEPKEDLPLRRTGSLGDTNQLNFYRHWQELMVGKSWDEIQNQPFDRV